jgi:hypothetical protein
LIDIKITLVINDQAIEMSYDELSELRDKLDSLLEGGENRAPLDVAIPNSNISKLDDDYVEFVKLRAKEQMNQNLFGSCCTGSSCGE